MPVDKDDEAVRKKLGDIIVGYAFASPRNQDLKAAVDDAMQLIHACEAEAFKAGVAMSGGDLEFQDAFYEQWQLNLKHTQSQLKENREETV